MRQHFSYRGMAVLLFSSIVISCHHETTQQKDAEQPLPIAISKAMTKDTTALPPGSLYNRLALYMAGIRQDAPETYSIYQQDSLWQKFAVASDSGWTKLNRTKFSRIQSWAARALQGIRDSTHTVFYPFSGPDILHAIQFFPHAKEYILIGLEPTGTLPDAKGIAKDSTFFFSMQHALYTILNFSFFRTKSMAVDFSGKELDGTLPLLLVFLARTQHTITDIQPIEVDTAGYLVKSSFTTMNTHNPGKAQGVKILFKSDSNDTQSMYYFSADLSNGKLMQNKGFIRFMKTRKEVTTYLKSASYLMHKDYFSIIRYTILSNSNFVLQDDSGIPFRLFIPSMWNTQLYGTYKGPIALFETWRQPDLEEAYKDSIGIKPLPLGIGYNWKINESNLMLARKKYAL